MEDAMFEFIKNYSLGIIIVETIVIGILVFVLVICLTSKENHPSRHNHWVSHKYGMPETRNTNHNSQSRSRTASTPQKRNTDQTQQAQSIQESKPVTAKSDLPDNKIVQEDKPQTIYHYLQEANGGKFLRQFPTPDKCFFRTWEIDGIRKYEFCGNVAKALANINAIFDDVCEIEGKRHGATDIENVSAGTLDSELRITSKAKIRLK